MIMLRSPFATFMLLTAVLSACIAGVAVYESLSTGISKITVTVNQPARS